MNRAHQQLAAAVVQVWKMQIASPCTHHLALLVRVSIMMLYRIQVMAQTAWLNAWWRAAVATTPRSAHVSLLCQGLLKAAKSNLAAGICMRCYDASAVLRFCWLECEKCEKYEWQERCTADPAGGVVGALPECYVQHV